MLSTLIQSVKNRATAANAFLLLSELRDEAFGDKQSTLNSFLNQRKYPDVHVQDDRIFRHCSVVSHLYAVYEDFVHNSLQLWLARMPRYYRFSHLDESLQNAYRSGMATLIRDIGKRQFRHLSLLHLLERYTICIRDDQPWQFVPEALTLHEINLRRSELERMFTVVGFHEFWHLLEGNRYLKLYMENADDLDRVETLLDYFVTYRNEASHGIPDEILGSDSLRQWISFTTAICEAIAEIITIKTLSFEKALNPSCVIGHVSEKYGDNIVVAKCSRCELYVGQQLYFLKPSSVTHAIIESLQLDDKNVIDIKVQNDEVEVGMRMSSDVRKRAEILDISL